MNFNSCNFSLIAFFYLVLAFSSLAAQDLDTTSYLLKNEHYKDTPQGKLSMDIYYPQSYQDNAKLPTVVFFFGGGWVGGNRQHFAPQAKYLASRGLIAITSDYRTKNEHGTTPQQAVMDARSAMRFVKENATELGIDTTRLAAGGGSAGGHLAMATATLSGFDDAGDNQEVSPMPNALLLYNPVVNTTSAGYGAEKVGEDTLNLSPYHRIMADAPPVLIFHGEDDTVVPILNINHLKAKLDALLVPNVVHTYPGQGHGFFNLGREEGEYFRKTLYQTDLFLQSLGFLNGGPTFKP